MSRTDKIIQQVSSSMAMEGLPLSAADQERIRVCLTEPEKLEQMIAELLKSTPYTQAEELGMTDYSYEYQWDMEYCYSNSNVLRNKLNITDSEALAAAEREITSLRLAAASIQPIKGCFDLKHLQKIHKALFSDLYPWAGQLRHVNISKGNQFCLAMNLTAYANTLFGELEREHYLIDCAEGVPHRLAYYLSEINVLHPFREGNGRTQRLFIEYLAGVAGYQVDFSDVTAQEMIVASADSFACEYDRIYEMFDRITTPTSAAEQEANIRFFFGVRSQAMKWFKEK